MAESFTVYHPGRYGDLFWALPTVRALTEREGMDAHLVLPTDPANTTPMQGMVALLQGQDYLASVRVEESWSITQDAPRAPRFPPNIGHEDNNYALGYREWPRLALPYEVAELAAIGIEAQDDHFFRPWITVPKLDRALCASRTVVVHWTDRYFELKLGILHELQRALLDDVHNIEWYAGPGSRMADAGAVECGWLALARAFTGQQVVLTDCSAAHVLATAVGVPNVLVVEPEEARHHFIFWPGSDVERGWKPRNTVLGHTIQPVLGGDGKPTFDSRHTIDEVRRALRR